MPSGVYKRIRGVNFFPELAGGKKGCTPWNRGLKMTNYQHCGFQKGENHYRWIKDRSLVNRNERNNPEYKLWVRKVKNRDGWKCKMKSENCQGYCIVHHILPWRDFIEERYSINNDITLCQAHHPRKRVDEQKLIPFFQSMVEVK